MQPIIKIENLSKQYRLGTIGTGTLRNDLKRWWFKTIKNEDPFLKIGESNDRSVKGNSEYVWALKDINLEVMPGDVFGIIGKNGAGKSTLLKILSKVTGPTTGKIQFNGRIGSLLEVGTGFHPELTGLENIFLNGAILGMTKAEIRRKLDEIIDFSGCERYIDTPVKRYSSGMTVRLGFAVAAHLEPEILVVDEVLAVGDAEFQKKAIGKMQDVSRNDGRTVLFVSHNMFSIKKLCTKGLLLNNGTIATIDTISKVVEKYEIETVAFAQPELTERSDREGSGKVKAIKCILKNKHNVAAETIVCGDPFTLEITIERFINSFSSSNIQIAANICNLSGEKALQLSNFFIDKPIPIESKHTTIRYKINKFPLNPGSYTVRLFIADDHEIFDWIDYCLVFHVEEGDFFNTGKIDNSSVFFIDHTMELVP